jgi:SAM-dependent methyltransferase
METFDNIELLQILRYFTHNTTFEQNLVHYISSSFVNLYSPVVVLDKLICDGIRPLNTYKERLDTLPTDFKRESVLDLGCNTGYMLLDIKKYKNAGRCDGIDFEKNSVFIAKSIAYYERLLDIEFNIYTIRDIVNEILTNKIIKFDNILCFGVFEFNQGIEKDVIPDLVKCAKKRIIFEMANHPCNYKSPDEIKECVKVFEQFGKVKTTILKYQNRPVIEIDVSKNEQTENPTVVSLDD